MADTKILYHLGGNNYKEFTDEEVKTFEKEGERILDTDKYLYQFVGGQFNGKLWHYAALEVRNLIEGYSKDLSGMRAKGVLCKRAELDNQPLVKGYYPPMYNGTKEVDGVTYHVIRYETAEVYDMMSN